MKRSIAAIFVGLLLLSFVPTAMAGTEAPTWNETNEWAYGGKAYLDIAKGNDQYEMLKNIIDLFTESELKSLYMNGTVEAYVYISVTNTTADEMIVHMALAVQAKAIGNVKIDATLPLKVDGELTGEKVTKTISGDVDLDLVFFATMDMKFNSQSMAIRSMDSTSEIIVSASLSASNIPLEDANGTTQFHNFDVSANVNSVLNVSATFAPALDVMKFPLEVGEKWTVYSKMNVTGDLRGSASVEGISDGALANIIPAEYLNKFKDPVDLSQFTGDYAGYEIENGEFGPYNQDIEAKMHCVSKSTMETGANETIDVYRINVNENSDGEAEMIILYSPQMGFVQSFEATSEVINEIDTSEIPTLSLIDLELEDNLRMIYMEPNDAAEGIERITGESIVTKTPKTSSSGMDTGMIMVIALIGIAVIAVIAVAFVMMKRKK